MWGGKGPFKEENNEIKITLDEAKDDNSLRIELKIQNKQLQHKDFETGTRTPLNNSIATNRKHI